MKVYVTVILVYLNKFHISENSGSWDIAQMLLAYQIAGFLYQSQDSN